MNASFREIARTMDPDTPPTCLSDLFARHRWLPGTHPSFREIVQRHQDGKNMKFLSFNTYLMGLPNPQPSVLERSGEIGPMLRSEGYDVMALCEVWDELIPTPVIIVPIITSQAFKLRILHAFGWNEGSKIDWPADSEVMNERYARGPGPTSGQIDSGLLTVCANPNFKIVAHSVSTKVEIPDSDNKYSWGWWSAEKGNFYPNPTSDDKSFYRKSEGWDKDAEKGILLSCIDIGVGILEVYSTHLYSGDPKDHADIYQSNLEDLVTFFNQTHDPRNVAVITGDINIDALGSENNTYTMLKNTLNELKMDDVWLKHWGSADQAGFYGEKNPGGYTNVCSLKKNDPRIFKTNDDPVRISKIKKKAGKEILCEKDNLLYCKEPSPSPIELKENMCTIDAYDCDRDPVNDPLGKRIDYIFIQQPNSSHTINVDVTRIRRRAFPRDPDKCSGSDMKYLSDHFGLDVTFIISRR